MSKATDVGNNTRKFSVTKCEKCGNYDGVVEQIVGYSSVRDIDEWTREGRKVIKYTKWGKEPIPFCVCPIKSIETIT